MMNYRDITTDDMVNLDNMREMEKAYHRFMNRNRDNQIKRIVSIMECYNISFNELVAARDERRNINDELPRHNN